MIWRRTAPDRRDAHLIEVLQRGYMDLPERARLRGPQARGRVGDRLEEHDLAGNVDLGEVARPSKASVDDLPAQSLGAGWTGERVGDAVGRLVADLQPGCARQADVCIVQNKLRTEAVIVELAANVVEALKLFGRPG